jgi:hypothetical protein
VLPFSSAETYFAALFPFLRTASKSSSGVARGNCGLDLVCLPLEATTDRTGSSPAESSQWSRQVHSSNLQVLISDAPSEIS